MDQLLFGPTSRSRCSSKQSRAAVSSRRSWMRSFWTIYWPVGHHSISWRPSTRCRAFLYLLSDQASTTIQTLPRMSSMCLQIWSPLSGKNLPRAVPRLAIDQWAHLRTENERWDHEDIQTSAHDKWCCCLLCLTRCSSQNQHCHETLVVDQITASAALLTHLEKWCSDTHLALARIQHALPCLIEIEWWNQSLSLF